VGDELRRKEAEYKHAQAEDLASAEEVKSMRRSKGMYDIHALAFYLKAAEQGMADAQFRVGLFFQNGWGKPKDAVRAVSWYVKASNQGQKDAQLYLAACLENGEGVARDEIEAYAYYNLAGITNEQARARLSNLEKRMTPEARLLGQDRTKQLQREIEGKLDTIEDLRKAVEKEKQLKGA
jgi:TPR repeat protein